MSDDAERSFPGEDLRELTAEVASAFLANNELPAERVPEAIRAIHAALSRLGVGRSGAPEPTTPVERPKPAVPISKSVQDDYLVCLEDGKRMTMLKRYLRARYDMTPEDYRRRWGLPHDYPMVAPAYAARRSHFARQIGLGTGVRRGG